VLKGFNLIAVYQRDEPAAESGFKMRRYVLTDGVATISVFVQSKASAGPLNEDVKRKGALSMLSRPIQDAWVTVMGEIPPETLRLFAQSIEWKTSP
jgi:sigma-E factor negative regulatory protein RseB